jgi:hypothetical protein
MKNMQTHFLKQEKQSAYILPLPWMHTYKHKTQKTNNKLFQAPYGYRAHDKHCVASTAGLGQYFGNFFTLGLLLGHTTSMPNCTWPIQLTNNDGLCMLNCNLCYFRNWLKALQQWCAIRTWQCQVYSSHWLMPDAKRPCTWDFVLTCPPTVPLTEPQQHLHLRKLVPEISSSSSTFIWSAATQWKTVREQWMVYL